MYEWIYHYDNLDLKFRYEKEGKFFLLMQGMLKDKLDNLAILLTFDR